MILTTGITRSFQLCYNRTDFCSFGLDDSPSTLPDSSNFELVWLSTGFSEVSVEIISDSSEISAWLSTGISSWLLESFASFAASSHVFSSVAGSSVAMLDGSSVIVSFFVTESDSVIFFCFWKEIECKEKQYLFSAC